MNKKSLGSFKRINSVKFFIFTCWVERQILKVSQNAYMMLRFEGWGWKIMKKDFLVVFSIFYERKQDRKGLHAVSRQKCHAVIEWIASNPLQIAIMNVWWVSGHENWSINLNSVQISKILTLRIKDRNRRKDIVKDIWSDDVCTNFCVVIHKGDIRKA